MVEDALYFDVDSQLLSELGERLVGRNYIALSELIKNSYDADATNVMVKFENVKKDYNLGKITVEDNGSGMTFEEVKKYWMKVATPYKRLNPTSDKYGRGKTGDKGIGRFACRKLAKKLVMESIGKISEKKFEYTRVEFDWEKYKSGKRLQDIQNIYTRKNLKNVKTGVKLILSNLNETWSEGDFNVLRRYLVSLSISKGVRRNEYEEDPGFNIEFEAPEFKLGTGFLLEQFMDAGWGRLEGKIENDIVRLSLNAKNIGITNYELPIKFKELSGITFSIAYIPLYSKELLRDTKTLSISLARELSYNAGIKIYFKGFRVYPYGGPEDDWLKIDQDVAKRKTAADEILKEVSEKLVGVDHSRAFLYHPSNRNLFGYINIDEKASKNFSIKINREGFIYNESFENLIRAMRLSLEWLTLHYSHFYYEYKKEKVRKEEKSLREELKLIKDEKKELLENKISIHKKTIPEETSRKDLTFKAINILEEESKRNLELFEDKEKNEIEKRIKVAKNYLESSFEFTEEEIDHLRTVASTGALIMVYSHEIRDLVHQLDRHSKTIRRISRNFKEKEKIEILELSESIDKTKNRFRQQLKLFGLLAKGIKEGKKKLSLKAAINEVIYGFSFLKEYFGIEFDSKQIEKSIMIGPIYETELYSIIVNLISNAVKATISGDGNHIAIEAEKKFGKTNIKFSNEGIELSEKYWKKVFEPWFADPDNILYQKLGEKIEDEELLSLGKGSGIGLSIVKGIIEKNGGSIQFIEPQKPFKNCVEVIL